MEILDNSKDLSLLNLDSLTNEDRDNINDFQRKVKKKNRKRMKYYGRNRF